MTTTPEGFAMVCGECGKTTYANHAPSFCPACRAITGRFMAVGHEVDFSEGLSIRMKLTFHGKWTEGERAHFEALVRKKK